MVWALMQSVGEVTTMFPIAGGFIEVRLSFCFRPFPSSAKTEVLPFLIILFLPTQHATRFVDPAFSFSMAWLYYFMWSVFLAAGKRHPDEKKSDYLSIYGGEESS
jgi:amino acid transporter